MIEAILQKTAELAAETGYAAYAYVSDGQVTITDRYPVAEDLIILRVQPDGQWAQYRELPEEVANENV